MNGGLTKPSYELTFPNSYLTDTIKFTFKKPTLEKSFLHEKYVVEDLSSKEIAVQIFSSRPAVTKLLRENGIPLKTITRKNNGGYVYGFRKYSGRSIELKKEQEVIKLIKTYRYSGYSYQKIADILNERKVQTKSKKSFWYSKVVRQICLRND